jgi:hypothetical protein
MRPDRPRVPIRNPYGPPRPETPRMGQAIWPARVVPGTVAGQ